MELVPVQEVSQFKKWEHVLSEKLPLRTTYLIKEQKLHYTRIAKQFLGVYSNTYDMQEYIYGLTKLPINWTLLFDHLPKEIDPQHRTEIVNILQLNKQNPISLNRFMAFFSGKQLLPLMNSTYRNHFANTFRTWLAIVEARYPRLLDNQLQRIFLDFVKWSNYYFPKWLASHDFQQDIPKILWFGAASESETFFLYFLYLFGFDVIVFEPDGTNIFKTYGIDDFPTEQLGSYVEPFDFPYEPPVVVQTLTAQAAEQVQQHLYDNPALNYAWKYADYETRTRILNTTYDELFIVSGAEMYLREGFHSEEQIVYLPVLFAKVNHISANYSDFVQKLQQLQKREYTLIETKFPLAPLNKSNMQFHMRDASTNGQLDAEKIIQLSIWPFRHFSIGAQKNIANTMIRLIDSDILPLPIGKTKKEHEHFLFGQMLVTPMEIMRMYQQFDYSYLNPTYILFKEEQSGEMQIQDAVLLVFLNMLGFDVFIFNPAGTLAIEHFIADRLLNSYKLEKTSFDTTFERLIATPVTVDDDLTVKIDLKSIFKRISRRK